MVAQWVGGRGETGEITCRGTSLYEEKLKRSWEGLRVPPRKTKRKGNYAELNAKNDDSLGKTNKKPLVLRYG